MQLDAIPGVDTRLCEMWFAGEQRNVHTYVGAEKSDLTESRMQGHIIGFIVELGLPAARSAGTWCELLLRRVWLY